MKSILLTTVFSIATFFGALAFLKNQDNKVYDCRLPEVLIKAERIQEKMPEIILPEVIISAPGHGTPTLPLPEVVVTASQSKA